jgi:putative ABC transport system permease protein
MLNLEADLEAKMSRDLRGYGPNLLIVPAAGPPGGSEVRTLDEGSVRALGELLREAESAPVVSPLLLAAGSISGHEGADRARRSMPLSLAGADFDALRRLNPSWRVEGEWPRDGALGCVLGASLARGISAAPGASVEISIGGRPGAFAVSAVISTGEREDDQAFVPLAWLQEATGLAGRVSIAALSIAGGSEAVERAARVAARAIPGSEARPLRQIAAAQGAILAKLGRMMVLLTGVILALSALCLATTLMSVVIEREQEIGLMRSIGAGHGAILAMFLGEVALLGLLGGAIGVAVGSVASGRIGARLFETAIEPRAEVVPWVLAGSVALCVASAIVPLRRALAVQPAAALRGQ